MASIIQGYEYDIFISYRHNDNRSGWVTEFVSALKQELAATIKESVSVYFDNNPQDGLLETHDVGGSLKEKIKCLVFIPIVSQTFCDTNAFAWQHEFLPFLDFCKTDNFGLEIRLPDGNVTKRVLPVRIHEIDETDKNLFEAEIGGVMRPVDFIFKSSGVNRPLTSSDKREENSNKTLYRDQINKVANAIKEIITGIKNPDIISISESDRKTPRSVTLQTKNRKSLVAILSSVLLLLLIGYLLYPKLLKSSSLSETDKSIAVLHFVNMSNDPDQDYFSEGITEEILDHLVKIEDLRVTSRTTSMKYRGSKLSVREIGSELGVANILEGSVRKQGNHVKITAQLIDAKNDVHLWSQSYDRELKDVLGIQSDVASQVALSLKAKLSPELIARIDRMSTTNPEAYDFYLKGLKQLNIFWERFDIAHIDTSQGYFSKAIKLDPNYSMAYAMLGASWWYQGHWALHPTPFMYDESIRNLHKAIELDPKNGVAFANLAVVQHNWLWDKDGAKKSLETALTLMPNSEEVWQHLIFFQIASSDCEGQRRVIRDYERQFNRPAPSGGSISWKVMALLCEDKNEEALALDPDNGFANLAAHNYQKAKKIFNPDQFSFNPIDYMGYGLALVGAGQLDSVKLFLSKLESIEKIRYVNPAIFAVIYKALGNETMADVYIEKGFEARDLLLHWMVVFGPYHTLRNDPKVKEIIARSWIPMKE